MQRPKEDWFLKMILTRTVRAEWTNADKRIEFSWNRFNFPRVLCWSLRDYDLHWCNISQVSFRQSNMQYLSILAVPIHFPFSIFHFPPETEWRIHILRIFFNFCFSFFMKFTNFSSFSFVNGVFFLLIFFSLKKLLRYFWWMNAWFNWANSKWISVTCSLNWMLNKTFSKVNVTAVDHSPQSMFSHRSNSENWKIATGNRFEHLHEFRCNLTCSNSTGCHATFWLDENGCFSSLSKRWHRTDEAFSSIRCQPQDNVHNSKVSLKFECNNFRNDNLVLIKSGN